MNNDLAMMTEAPESPASESFASESCASETSAKTWAETSESSAAAKRIEPETSSYTLTKLAAEAVEEKRTARNVRRAIEDHDAPRPVETPRRPTPTETAKEPDTNAGTESDERWSIPWLVNVTGIHVEWRAINEPRIVIRQIACVGNTRFDDDRGPLTNHALLWRTLQVACCLRSLTHHLNRIEHILLLIEVSVAQRRRPR